MNPSERGADYDGRRTGQGVPGNRITPGLALNPRGHRAARFVVGFLPLAIVGAVGAGVLPGCASPSSARGLASGSGGPATDPPAPVASVGEERIGKGELADFLFHRAREQWLDALDDLVDERIVVAEARALGVVVPPAALSAAVEAEVEARKRKLEVDFGAGAELEASVRAYYGMDLAGWRRAVLEPRLRVRLLLARVVRLSARLREHVVARVIVTRDRAAADAAAEKVRLGADFSLLALEASVDGSRTLGGVIPPIARGDLGRPEVEAALFRTAPGAVVGPLKVRVGVTVEWHLYKVVERVAPWSSGPTAWRTQLEDDLLRSPVTRAEFQRWSSTTRARYGVRYFAPDGALLPTGLPTGGTPSGAEVLRPLPGGGGGR